MEVLNLATSALFDSLTRHGLNKELLLEGTHLDLGHILDVKKKHSWNEFVIMYNNCARFLGHERAAREIAHQGVHNQNVTIFRKIATGLLDAKSIYWFLGTVACRHLFKDTVKFSYKKIKANQVQMEIEIAPELEDCQLLLETYTYLFENIPNLLGLPKANVSTTYSTNKAVYTIKLIKSSYLRYIYAKFTRSLSGYTNAILLMEELESQSLQLSKLLDEKSELLRIMSHDISNIASTIDMSLTQVLNRENLQEEDQFTILKTKQSSDRLKNILKNIQKLELAHVRGVALGPIDMDEIFEDTRNNFKEQLHLKNMTLTIANHLPHDTKAYAERVSFEENVLSNLVSNAIKFSNEGSNIHIESDLLDGQVVISISDEGLGISPEKRRDLFTQKLRKSTLGTSGEIGSGFGLGIVNTYIKLYNGKISAHQNFPKGTIIKISLPLYLPQNMDANLLLKEGHYPGISMKN
jgi:signal transduction histidine kinase